MRSVGDSGAASLVRRVREIVQHRELLWLLTRRDLQVRYRGSALGFLWTLIKPLIMLATYYLVLGQILGAARGIPAFAIYVFAGLTIYLLFSESVGAAAGSIVNNAGLVKKIYVPREIFPLASVGGALFIVGMQFVVLIAAIVVSRQWPDPMGLLYLIPSLLLILVYALAFGLLLSVLNVYLRDVQYISEILLTILMWASPIVYSWRRVGELVAEYGLPAWVIDVYTNNPITLAVLGIHRALWAGGTPADYPADLWLRMLIAGVAGLVLLMLAQLVFQRRQGNVAQEL
jgi:ABC-2 type transport system permease protein